MVTSTYPPYDLVIVLISQEQHIQLSTSVYLKHVNPCSRAKLHIFTVNPWQCDLCFPVSIDSSVVGAVFRFLVFFLKEHRYLVFPLFAIDKLTLESLKLFSFFSHLDRSNSPTEGGEATGKYN